MDTAVSSGFWSATNERASRVATIAKQPLGAECCNQLNDEFENKIEPRHSRVIIALITVIQKTDKSALSPILKSMVQGPNNAIGSDPGSSFSVYTGFKDDVTIPSHSNRRYA